MNDELLTKMIAEFQRLQDEHDKKIAKINRDEKLMTWGLIVAFPLAMLIAWSLANWVWV